MARNLVRGYLLFCILFVLALLALVTIRVKTSWDRNFKNAHTRFSQLRNYSSSFYLSYKRFDSPEFLQRIRDIMAVERRLLLLLSIHTPREGFQYLYSSSPDYVAGKRGAGIDWPGKPEYGSLPLGSQIFTRPFLDPGTDDHSIDGIFVILGQDDLFPIMREIFIVLFVFFIATCVVLILIPNERGEQTDTGRPSRGGEPERARDTSRDSSRGDSRNLFSPESGLGWSDHLPQRLKFEIDRAAATDQDLVLALIAIDNYGSHPHRQEVYNKIAKMILEEFNFQDLDFEYREGCFAVIIPDTDLDRGIVSLNLFGKRVASHKDLRPSVTLSLGLGSRNGRLVTGVTLLEEASKALDKANRDKAKALYAFRADPDKYREAVSKKN